MARRAKPRKLEIMMKQDRSTGPGVASLIILYYSALLLYTGLD